MIAFLKSVTSGIGWALVWMPVAHFVLSAGVGLSVYYLILTILSHGRFSIYLKERQSSHQGFSIHRFSLVVALCFAVAVHILEDYTLNIF